MQIELNRPAGVKLLTGGKLCPADLIVTPVLQHKTVTENGMVTPDAGFAGLSGVQVSVAGGGACDKPHIIQVDTLPTENMDETAVYLCGGNYYTYKEPRFLDCYMYYPSYDMVISYQELAAAEGIEFTYHIIPTRAAEGILESVEPVIHLYWILDENVVGNLIDGEWTDMPVTGVVADASELVADGHYVIGQSGGWTKYFSPVGTLAITENGTHDVSGYASAEVHVPVPEGYVQPSGTKAITANGTHDVSGFAQAQVAVAPILQEKTARANGTVTPDSGYDGLSRVTVNVPVPEGYVRPSGTKEITENGTYDVSNYAGATVNVERTDGGGIVLHPVAQPTIQLGTNITAGHITGMNVTAALQPISNLTITEGE